MNLLPLRDLRLALIKMEEHKSVTVQVDKAAGKIYVDGVLPNATLCLYHIRGKVIEVKQAREESASFDLPCSCLLYTSPSPRDS